jgi:hypothetical protein
MYLSVSRLQRPRMVRGRARDIPGAMRVEITMASTLTKILLIVVIAASCSGCSRKDDSGIGVPGGHNGIGNSASSPRADTDS